MEEFKVGDVVYDCVLFPNKRGKVVEITTGHIEIRFDKYGSKCYHLNGAFYEYSIPTLRKYKYEVEIKKTLPKLGDEGLFWNDTSDTFIHGIIYGISSCGSDYRRYQPEGYDTFYANFKPMTKEEFDKIREL